MVEIKVFTGDQLINAAKLAIEHRLFVNEEDWDLCNRLRSVEQQRYTGALALAFVGEQPVACGLARDHRKDYATYVKPEHRRQKIGSQMLQKLREDGFFVDHWVATGGVGSNAFWQANAVKRHGRSYETDEVTGCLIYDV